MEQTENKTAGNSKMTLKMLGLLVIIGIVWATSLLVSFVTWDRSGRQEEVNHEIAQTWGDEQFISGPILAIPFGDAGEKLLVLPDTLHTEVVLEPETRSRGVFTSIVYTAHIKGSGVFSRPDVTEINQKSAVPSYSESALVLGISDTKGIASEMQMTWKGASVPVQKGTRSVQAVGAFGAHTLVDIRPDTETYEFTFDIALRGSNTLNFLPLSKTETVSIASKWPSPSFVGSYLPTSRDVSSDGFTAEWDLTSLNTMYREQWIEGQSEVNTPYSEEERKKASFGVRLHQDVDLYSMVNRMIKYSILFIVLTFITFFMFEVMSGLRLHPFQYLLVGLAIALFYLLLLSFAEQIGFLPAYILSSIMVVGIITSYCASILKKKRRAFTIASLLTALYTYLYIIVQLEELSLIFGSIALFLVLATVMYLTRNINWYTMDVEKE